MPTDFNEMARSYDDDAKVERSRAIAAAMASAIPLDATMTALDYGAGTGLLAVEMARHVGRITLADSSEGMREVAAERIAARPDAERFTLVHLDLAEEAAAQAYDLVYSSLVLHHIDDTRGILRALFDALVPGGWLAVADLDHDHDNHFHPDDFGGHTGFARHHLAADAVAAGFESPTFTTATTLTKPKDGVEHTFEVFLMVARRPV